MTSIFLLLLFSILKGHHCSGSDDSRTSILSHVTPSMSVVLSATVTNSSSHKLHTLHPSATIFNSSVTKTLKSNAFTASLSSAFHTSSDESSSASVVVIATSLMPSGATTLSPSNKSSPMTTMINPTTVMTDTQVKSATTLMPTGEPVIIYKCGEECISLRSRLHTATGFCLVFLAVGVVLGVLLYRQVKINKENQYDPSLSRLI